MEIFFGSAHAGRRRVKMVRRLVSLRVSGKAARFSKRWGGRWREHGQGKPPACFPRCRRVTLLTSDSKNALDVKLSSNKISF